MVTVRSGERAAHVTGTRIQVWLLVAWGRVWSRERVLSEYPTLSAAQLDAALAYGVAHPDEIAADIAENESW